ncbi:BMC domain-containing protein [Clostridium estertheticum]|uniref:BMC domain-containing protein n=1 Tax=Clostridium estertheticum TaxID=238834 RepID=UPI0013E97172|nr:BMC domain-containing protein [Clostridium estertheticum]MBZ9686053.1 BMC domain-containing protein [Clostridium estertheticum]
MKALGFVEVSGVVAAVEALDSMLKTADVEFVTWENKLGGRLVTIVITGSISSVNEAVEIGSARANAITKTVAHAIIANPHEEVIKLIQISAKKLNLAKSGEAREF